MLFLPFLKSNVHLHLSKFKGFLSSQHVVRDAMMKMMAAAVAQPSVVTVSQAYTTVEFADVSRFR